MGQKAEAGNNDLEPGAVIGSRCGGVIDCRWKLQVAKFGGVTHRRDLAGRREDT
jgi:hypothetical protein